MFPICSFQCFYEARQIFVLPLRTEVITELFRSDVNMKGHVLNQRVLLSPEWPVVFYKT